MKTFIILFITFFTFTANAATTVLYRIASGEILGISDTEDFGSKAGEYGLDTVTNPTIQDGTIFRDPSTGRRRVLGYAKIYSGGVVRNATQQEIDTFSPAEINDNKQVETLKAISDFENNPAMRRVLKAIIKELVDQLNVLRQEHGLSQITYQQAYTAIKNRIDKDD